VTLWVPFAVMSLRNWIILYAHVFQLLVVCLITCGHSQRECLGRSLPSHLCMSHGGTIHSSPVCMLVSAGGFELGVPNV
jgi:hypothetical protein